MEIFLFQEKRLKTIKQLPFKVSKKTGKKKREPSANETSG